MKMFRGQFPFSWAVITRDGLVLCILVIFGISVPLIELIGTFYLLISVVGISIKLFILFIGIARSNFLRKISEQTQNTPWYQTRRNQEGLAIERIGIISAAVFVVSILCLTHFFNANIYGVAICNLVVALATRYAVAAGWAWKQWRRLRENEDSADNIMGTLKANQVMPAKDRAIASGAIASTLFAQDNIEPAWLVKWWVMYLIILVVIVSVGKMYTVWQPIELWHSLTKDQHRDED